MKPLFFSIAFLVTLNIFGQNCNNGFFPVKSGTSWEITSYNPSNKVESKTTSTINTLTNNSAGFKANVSAKSEDKNGKETYNSTFDVECLGNSLKMDMKNFMGPGMLDAYKDMKIELTNGYIETPNVLNIGDSLKNGDMTMNVKSGDMVITTMNILIYDRKVLSKETVTVPAGTYSCYKISYKIKVTNAMTALPTPMVMVMETTQWISQGVGIVKTENYSKGKLNGTSLLTKFTN